jgi:hypothetical protein
MFITLDLSTKILEQNEKINIINDYISNPDINIDIINPDDTLENIYRTFIKLIIKEMITYYMCSSKYSIDIFNEKYNIILSKNDNFFNQEYSNFLNDKLIKNKYDLYVTYVNILHQEILFMFELTNYEILSPPYILIYIDDITHEYIGHIIYHYKKKNILSFISIYKSIYANRDIKISDIFITEIEKIAYANNNIEYVYTLYPFETMKFFLEKKGYEWMIIDGVKGFKDKVDVFAKKIR